MPQERSRPPSRRRFARPLLAFSFFLLRIGDFLIAWFLLQPPGNYRPMMGAVIGSAIATTALLAVIWNRQGWARYVLLTLLWAVVGIFCIPAISLVSIMDEVPRSVVGALFGGIALYLVAILILTVSRPIQRLAKNDVG